jgi:hypothetical protein
MRFRQVVTIPVVAAIGLSGAVAFGGCGSDSNAATDGSTTDSMHHSAMKHEGDSMKHGSSSMKHEGSSMKHDDGAMKHEGEAMHHEGSSNDHMEG